ncbi:MAG: hypothetical protein ACR2ND_01750 [Solirubrobacteraceae bacterium]
MSIKATLFTDPGCPWAYSASPALAVLRWRYREGLDWELCTVGLAEAAKQYEERGYTPACHARHYGVFRERFGMPFAAQLRARLLATGRACRAIVAARLQRPGSEWQVLRALQFAWFTSDALLDEDAVLYSTLAAALGEDPRELIDALDSPQVEAAYQDDLARTRSAAGSPTEFQGKAATSDGPVRYTAPSVIFQAADGQQLEAGGFQPIEAYDVLIANLDPSLERHPPPESPLAALELYPSGLTTQEVAEILRENLAAVNRRQAEAELIDLVAAGEVRRTSLASDALWLPAG